MSEYQALIYSNPVSSNVPVYSTCQEDARMPRSTSKKNRVQDIGASEQRDQVGYESVDFGEIDEPPLPIPQHNYSDLGSRRKLLDLPNELLIQIASYLPGTDFAMSSEFLASLLVGEPDLSYVVDTIVYSTSPISTDYSDIQDVCPMTLWMRVVSCMSLFCMVWPISFGPPPLETLETRDTTALARPAVQY